MSNDLGPLHSPKGFNYVSSWEDQAVPLDPTSNPFRDDHDFRRYILGIAHRIARRHGFSEHAADFAQDAWVEVAALRAERPGCSWGFQVVAARNGIWRAMDRLKRQTARERAAMQERSSTHPSEAPEIERRADLLAAITTLAASKGWRVCDQFRRHLQGEDIADIARDRGVVHSTVARQVQDAARTVAAHLGVTLASDDMPHGTYLGELCRHRHDYQGTGRTLYFRQRNRRATFARVCVECSRERCRAQHARRRAANAERRERIAICGECGRIGGPCSEHPRSRAIDIVVEPLTMRILEAPGLVAARMSRPVQL